ncbi:MAG: mechanosensitive ion channel family protein [Planctomycetota bacterium]
MMARRTWLIWMLMALLTLCVNSVSFAQDTDVSDDAAAQAEPVNLLQTPRQTMERFLTAMNRQPEPDYDTAALCLDLTDVPAEAHRQICNKLLAGVLNKIERIDVTTIPDTTWPSFDTMTEYVFFPRKTRVRGTNDYDVIPRHAEVMDALGGDYSIVIVKGERQRWRFSAETVSNVDLMSERLRSMPTADATLLSEADLSVTARIESSLPGWSLNRFFGLPIWKWIAVALLIFVCMIFDYTVRIILRRIASRAILKRGGSASRETLGNTVRPFGMAAAAVLALVLLRYLELPPNVIAVAFLSVRLFTMFAMVWAAIRITDLVAEVFASKASLTVTRFDDLLIPLVRKAIKVFIAVMGIIYIANSMNVPLGPLLTSLGIGGAAFAFAAKDTVEHFFGSITVVLDRPFEVGDWVQIGDVEGTVEDVGLRSSRIRTFYNSLVTVPNGNLVRAKVDNYGRRQYRRWRTHVQITYDTSPETIDAFCEGIRELIRLHPYTRKDYYQVWLHQFGGHSLDILVYCFHRAPDWQTELRERHRLMLDIMRLAGQLKVEFAFPTQTLQIQSQGADAAPAEEGRAEPPGTRDNEKSERLGRVMAHRVTRNADWREGVPEPYQFRSAETGDIIEGIDAEVEGRGS